MGSAKGRPRERVPQNKLRCKTVAGCAKPTDQHRRGAKDRRRNWNPLQQQRALCPLSPRLVMTAKVQRGAGKKEGEKRMILKELEKEEHFCGWRAVAPQYGAYSEEDRERPAITQFTYSGRMCFPHRDGYAEWEAGGGGTRMRMQRLMGSAKVGRLPPGWRCHGATGAS